MSAEQAKAFIEKMKTDEAFRDRIMAIETPEERLNAIGAAGFECTGEEINEAANRGFIEPTMRGGLSFTCYSNFGGKPDHPELMC
ncbi:Nif11-like leader peptide family natural product precursor [Chlorobium limicola]